MKKNSPYVKFTKNTLLNTYVQKAENLGYRKNISKQSVIRANAEQAHLEYMAIFVMNVKKSILYTPVAKIDFVQRVEL